MGFEQITRVLISIDLTEGLGLDDIWPATASSYGVETLTQTYSQHNNVAASMIIGFRSFNNTPRSRPVTQYVLLSQHSGQIES